MKRLIFLTGAVVLLLALVASVTLVSAEQPGDRSAAQATGTLEGPRWVLVSYAGKDGKTAQAVSGAEATAQFEAGKVYGTTGCNTYNAPYEAKDDKLTVGTTATTMKMCSDPIMDQESAYLADIQAAASYKIAKDQLTIADAKGNTVLTFKAEKPIALTGGTWLMTSYNNGKQGVVSALADTKVTAVFGADGRVGGSAGCNTYSAPYTVDGKKIQIGQPVATMMMCPQPIMDQETQYLAALQTAATYKIEGSKLELRSATDALVATFMLQPEQTTALAGATWEMRSYNNGKAAVVSALADTKVTALFGTDGMVAGSSGCNNYSAPYQVDGSTIKIGMAVTTRKMCPQPVMEQETAYLKALTSAATYRLQGDALDLRTASDALAVSYALQPAKEAKTAPVTLPAPAPAKGQDLGNTYLTIRPAVSGEAAIISLRLNPDNTVDLATSIGKGQTVNEKGAWKDNGDGTLTVTLTEMDGKKLDKPKVITFQRDGTYLNATEYDKALYGESGLKLNQAADVARKVKTALVTLDLEAGFPLDPTFVSVNGGGEVDASLLGQNCKGYINRVPVVTVNWTGEADLVRTFFYSDSDATLVVLTPEGELLCNDNANEQLLDPVVEIKDPAPGQYRIWVGSAAKKQLIPGILVLTSKSNTNLDTFDLAKLVKRPTMPVALPKPAPQVEPGAVQKEIEALSKTAPELKPGVPLTADITAEGSVPLFQFPVTKTCAGLVSARPSYVFKVSGQPTLVSVFFEGDADASLLVLGNGGKMVECNDDAEAGNINPMVELSNLPDGAYAVYVGRLNPAQPVKGKLTISDVAGAKPATLAPTKK